MQQLWSDIIGIIKAPFIGELDLLHLFLLIGFILVFVAAWVMILNHVRMAAMEVV